MSSSNGKHDVADITVTSKMMEEAAAKAKATATAAATQNRKILYVLNILTTFLFVGASLGWGPMQLMVRTSWVAFFVRLRVFRLPFFTG